MTFQATQLCIQITTKSDLFCSAGKEQNVSGEQFWDVVPSCKKLKVSRHEMYSCTGRLCTDFALPT